MLAQYDEEAGYYAGGTELLLAMKHGVLSYKHLIDLKVIPGLDSIDLRSDKIEIGALATHRAIEHSDVVRQRQPVLAELESQVANVRVRATGTLGGNLCFADPHSDPATLLLVLGARLQLEGPGGRRELLAKIVVPCAQPNHRAAYLKFQVRERPTLGLGLWLESPDSGKTFTLGRVALGCVCPSPTRASGAETLLVGSREEVERRLPQAADAMADAARLLDDHEGSADYKRHLIHVFLRRAFRKALGEAPV
jgi:carbon-monoxide dehydrogenase medium subunit